uniref:Uncharacterized protein n=1 Tax=Physcomitrium patens TaxID=3218 RepID=A0A2K1IVE2_PHYPA|nr:hypothetical protein PHYPA_025185 [Physcomitrium patens]
MRWIRGEAVRLLGQKPPSGRCRRVRMPAPRLLISYSNATRLMLLSRLTALPALQYLAHVSEEDFICFFRLSV